MSRSVPSRSTHRKAVLNSSSPNFPTAAASPALQRYAWFLLAYNVLVVLWGTVVRATGSGGGCGDHWPLCNGVVLPQVSRFHTFVEFTHRLMSGATLVLVVIMVAWVWRATSRGNLARWAATASLVLVLNEALLGALLVIFGLVERNASAARAIYLSCHLTNTLLLLAALTLTAEFLSRPCSRLNARLNRGQLLLPIFALGATLIVGVSGSLAALGDTLFPATSLSSALQQDFSSAAPWLLRLRWLHPASAIVAGALVSWMLMQAFRSPRIARRRRLAIFVLSLFGIQYLLGVLDVLLRAPTWLQILHLLGADLLWITLVLLAVESCLIKVPSSETTFVTL